MIEHSDDKRRQFIDVFLQDAGQLRIECALLVRKYTTMTTSKMISNRILRNAKPSGTVETLAKRHQQLTDGNNNNNKDIYIQRKLEQ